MDQIGQDEERPSPASESDGDEDVSPSKTSKTTSKTATKGLAKATKSAKSVKVRPSAPCIKSSRDRELTGSATCQIRPSSRCGFRI